VNPGAQNSGVWFPIAVVNLLLFAQDVRFQEKIEVRLIEVSAVVTDREGHRVHGLTANDFEVYEGHAKQAITNFSEYRASPAEAPAATAEQPAAEPVQQHAREPHSLVVLFDSMPRLDFVREKAFQQLEQFLAASIRPGDHVSVVLWSGGYEHLQTIVDSSDANVIMSAVRAFGSRMPEDLADDPHAQGDQEAAAYASHSEIAARDKIDGFGGQTTISKELGKEQALTVLHRKTRGIARLIQALGSRPGRKALLYVSQTFQLEDVAAEDVAKRYVDEISAAANANGVVFYAARPFMPDDMPDASAQSGKFVDAQQWMLNIGALQRVTDATGGLVDFARSSVGKLAPMITEDLESYYSIAYQARSDGGDRVRNITVKTKNSAYRVRARTAVVEKSPATVAKDAVVSRLFSDEGANDVRFEIREGELKRTSGNRWLLPIFVRIPASQLQFAEEKGKQVAHAGVLMASANGLAEVTPVSENELRIVSPQDLDHGFVTYSAAILGDRRGSKVSIGIVDRRTGAIGVRTIDNRNRFH
jgi:VWFA-related protein